MRVFLAHSAEDRDFASRLRERLEQANIDVWSAQLAVRPGESIMERIATAIKAADTMLVILTRAAMDSGWVTSEIAFAVSGQQADQRKRIIPVLAEKDLELPPFLVDKQYVDLSTAEKYDHGISRLIQTTQSEIPVQNFDDFSVEFKAELKKDFVVGQRSQLRIESLPLLRKRILVMRQLSTVIIVTTMAVGIKFPLTVFLVLRLSKQDVGRWAWAALASFGTFGVGVFSSVFFTYMNRTFKAFEGRDWRDKDREKVN